MLLSEEELPVQIGQVNRVKINLRHCQRDEKGARCVFWRDGLGVFREEYDEYFLEVVETEGFEEFAADTACANQQGAYVAEPHGAVAFPCVRDLRNFGHIIFFQRFGLGLRLLGHTY